MSGIAGFATGLMQGIEARDRMDINREYKRALANRASMADRDWQNYLDLVQKNYQAEHGNLEGYVAPKRIQLQDPALLRFGKWLGTKIGWGRQNNTEKQGTMQRTAIPGQTPEPSPVPSLHDGGRVEGSRNYRRGLDYPILAGDILAYERDQRRSTDTGENTGQSITNLFDDTQQVRFEAYKDRQEAWDRMRNADNPREAGAAFSSWVGRGIKSGLGIGGALFKDVLADNPVIQFTAGALGFDGNHEQSLDENLPANEAPTDTAIPAIPETQSRAYPAIATAIPDPERSDEQVARTAMQEGEIAALENLDYRLLANQNVSPEELPSMTTQDWSAYRHAIFKHEVGRGASVREAAQTVDDLTVNMQMRGFQREGQKALLYLQTGQAREAAMALRQAYQYFPNGVSVRFGMANDPATRQPAIIAMGVDEQTNEPSGQPMLITSERLNAMMENMSNPSAFRVWTKDGRDLQMRINQLQSLDNYRQRSLDVAEARTMAGAASPLGQESMNYVDTDRRSDKYRDWAQNQIIMNNMDQGVAMALASAMGRVTRLRPDIPYITVIKLVHSAWDAGRGPRVAALLDELRTQ